MIENINKRWFIEDDPFIFQPLQFSVEGGTGHIHNHRPFVIYNDALTCVQWCQYAKKCVDEEAFKQLMEIARRQKERAAAR